jgi:hypothetical protein
MGEILDPGGGMEMAVQTFFSPETEMVIGHGGPAPVLVPEQVSGWRRSPS